MRIQGLSASNGNAVGKVRIVEPISFDIPNYKIVGVPKEEEIQRFLDARTKATNELKEIQTKTNDLLGEDYAAIIDAQISMVNDSSLLKEVKWAINHNHNATFAYNHACNKYIRIFSEMDNEYIKERIIDVIDIRNRVLKHLLNEQVELDTFETDTIIVAHDISPTTVVQFDVTYIKGFITEIGSDISHTAMLARSLQLPAVVQAPNCTELLENNQDCILNATEGFIERK